MVEIGFSVMENNAGDVEQLRPLLKTFEQQYHIHVNPVGIPWADGWTEIAKIGVYEHGADVCSVHPIHAAWPKFPFDTFMGRSGK